MAKMQAGTLSYHYRSFVNCNIMPITHYPHFPLRPPLSILCSSISRLHFSLFSIPIPIPIPIPLPIDFLHHFSSSSQIPNVHTSPIHQFLHKSCGLSPMEAVSASKYLQHLKTTKNPEQVVHFFRERGFSDAHIKAIVRSRPLVLTSSIPNTLLPKLALFEDIGIVDAQLVDLISNVPSLLKSNIERTLLPMITFLQDQLKSNEHMVTVLKRAPRILSYLDTLKSNMLFLQNFGIERRIILTFLIRKPRIFLSSETKLKEFLDATEKFGVPRSSATFTNAVLVVSNLTKDTIEQKINYLMSLGLSREEVLQIFKKLPATLGMSKENLKQHMDFLVNTLNLDPLVIVAYPNFLTYSIEKRLLPRYRVFHILQSLEVQKIKFMSTLSISEKDFLRKIVYKNRDSVRLYEIYMGLDAAASSKNDDKQKEVEP